MSMSVGSSDVSASKVTELSDDMSDTENKKRTFLKFAGAAGLGAAASLLVPGRAEALVFGSTPASNVVGLKDSANVRIDPAKEGGNLATVKTNTDPLVTAGGGGFVRQDSTATIAKETGGNLAGIKTNTDTFAASGAGGFVRQDSTGTIAKETGGNLATIATNIPAKGQALMAASMPVVIASDQGAIPVSGSFNISAVGIKDTTNTQVNPATDDAIVYLRRMVKLMESQATVDVANRQRVTVDMFPGNVATLPTYTAGATLPTVTTVSAVTSVTNMVTLAGQNQQMYQDVARNTYANGIRQNLIFS
jgi:predicted RNA-binding protein Jag